MNYSKNFSILKLKWISLKSNHYKKTKNGKISTDI